MPNVISFHYSVTDVAGKSLDSSAGRAPLTIMEGAGQIIPGLENAISGLKKGEKKHVKVSADQAYGAREESLVVKVTRDQLPVKDIRVGDRFRGGEEPNAPVFVVTDLTLNDVTLDANHPLAGQDLLFDVEITEIREATAEEMEHGHAHGEGHSHSH